MNPLAAITAFFQAVAAYYRAATVRERRELRAEIRQLRHEILQAADAGDHDRLRELQDQLADACADRQALLAAARPEGGQGD